jgi:glycolate oxidase FAD binding subunit
MTAALQAPFDQIRDQIRAASAAKTPLRIRGGGTKDFYAQRLEGQVLDMTAHSGIVSYEPSELVVTCKAGTPLAELEATLASQGQCLPFEPPHFSLSGTATAAPQGTALTPLGARASHDSGKAAAVPAGTVGGMVAAGLAGPARASVGGVRDYVLGVQMLNGKAEHLTFGGTVMKNVAGYDVSRLIAGSWGMLGVITEVSLKVLPIAPAEATLRFTMDEASMLHQVNTWGGQPLPLNASSWVVDAGVPTLYLRLRGAQAAVQAACQRLGHEAGAVRVDSPATRADWSAARDLQLPWFKDGFARGDDLWRLSVPQTAPPLHLGDTMVDWLGGQRWVWAAKGDAQAAQRIRSGVQAVHGSATLFVAADVHATGTSGRFDALKPPLDRIHRQLKAEFDPAGILNPGRMPWFA